MKLLRALFRWTFLFALLTAVGTLTFLVVRHRPRCTITGQFHELQLANDGSRLVTLPKSKDSGAYRLPQVRDTHGGGTIGIVHESPGDHAVYFSSDGRHGAVRLADATLRLVDWHTGQEWHFEEVRDVRDVEFSPRGRWLVVRTAMQRPNFIIDVAARKIALQVDVGWPRFAADDELLIGLGSIDKCIAVWDVAAGTKLGVVPSEGRAFEVSPDGRWLVIQRSEPPKRVGPPEDPRLPQLGLGSLLRQDHTVDVWDLTTFERRFHRRLARGGNLHATFSPDSRRLALWLNDDEATSDLEMIDASTGKLVWSYPMRFGRECVFAPDGTLCYLAHATDKTHVVTVFDVAAGRPLWQRPGFGDTHFAGATGIVLHQEDAEATPQELLDARSGAPLAVVPLDFPTANYLPLLTSDGRHFVIGGWQVRRREPYFWESWLDERWPELLGNDFDGALVMESTTGRELFRVVNRNLDEYHLSDDGSTLVTVRRDDAGQATIRIWDVHPRRAWTWAIGLAAGTWLGGWSVRRMWTTLRTHRAVT